MTTPPLTRRSFLRATVTGGALAGTPRALRAAPGTIKIGAVHPVTGGLAEFGQACRVGAQIGVDAVNAAGGIRSMGGATLELVPGDTQSSADVARTEAERVIGAGARLLIGAFHSGQTAAIVPVAQERRVPFLIDVSAADPITRHVAEAVRRGDEKAQYVYRNFPTTAMVGRRAVQYMTEIFRDAGQSPKRVTLIYTDDLFGQTQARQFQAAVKAMRPGFEIVDAIAYAEHARDLSTEVARLKATQPDVIAPVTRPPTAIVLLRELARQRVDCLGLVSPGAPGLYEPGQIALLKELLEHVMDNLPWPNFRNARTGRVADEYARRTGGKAMDTNPGYSYDAIMILADVLERAQTTDPDALVDAIRKTSLADLVMVSAGPVTFDDAGDNANAATAMVQIIDQRPVPVWPKEAAMRKFVFPRPSTRA